MNRRYVALTLLMVSGCARGSLRVAGPAPLPLPSTGRTVQVLAPRDRRPPAEVQGRRPGLTFLLPLVIYNAFGWRGSSVVPAEKRTTDGWGDLHRGLVRAVDTSGVARAARSGARADYVLETSVLHLATAQFKAGHAGFSIAAFHSNTNNFVPNATATLRLTLRHRSGRIVGQRSVSGQTMGGPGARSLAVARSALNRALARAQIAVAAWIRRDAAKAGPSAAEIATRLDASMPGGYTFLVRWIDADRLTVRFATVHCPTGRVVRRWQVRGLRVAGTPGRWVVSPHDENGVAYSIPYYSAMTRHLSRHFVLARLGALSTYTYVGRRTSSSVSRR